MRHLALHDPDAYKESQSSLRSNENHQLIDDEEEEEDDEDTILPGFSVDENTLDSQALHLTFDPQSQQMLNGEQVVVFEVVQVNENNGHSDQQQNSTITVGKSNLKAVSLDNENYIIQLQSEDDQAATQIEENSAIVDEPNHLKSNRKQSNQNDVSNCFGFEDEDED